MSQPVPTNLPTSDSQAPEQADLQAWRNHLLSLMLYGMSILGGLVVISSSGSMLQGSHITDRQQAFLLSSVLGGGYVCLLLITFVRRLGYTFRACTLLAVLYGTGMMNFYFYGTTSDGPVILFAIVMLTNLLFSYIWGMVALGIAEVSIVAMMWKAEIGLDQSPFTAHVTSAQLIGWLASMIIFLLLAVTVILTINYLIQHLIRSAAVQREAHQAEQRALQAEQRISQAFASQTARLESTERELRELVVTLEIPTVPLARGLLLAPIVGTLDSSRAERLTSRLLHAVASQQIHTIVIDLSGIANVNQEVLQRLMETTQALQLLGCQVALSGISVSLAIVLTDLNIDLGGVVIAQSPQTVLANYLRNQQS